jgi:hypothetical protein
MKDPIRIKYPVKFENLKPFQENPESIPYLNAKKKMEKRVRSCITYLFSLLSSLCYNY